ncbi:GTP-binding protein ypt1 [Phlyctema vagabunda]|uniref:GTP-binding protein ypt1 n=1 Tax=Phlyctema vagabunda TaxID=108571 RepID=A0ABR4PR39_9HELO
MASDESLPTLKILMIGPSGAGKSALLIRYCDDQFDSESSTATIGVDFKLKKLSVHGKAYRLNLLDTAGQERFRTLSNSYYRGAHGVILVYDISSRESFLAMERWFDEAESNAMPGAVMYLVGSKSDRAANRKVKVEEGEALAASHGAQFCEVSSKTKENVRKPFIDIVDQISQSPELLAASNKRRSTIAVGSTSDDVMGSGCSC